MASIVPSLEQFPLQKCSPEVQAIICQFACQHNEPIRPRYYPLGSSKFTHDIRSAPADSRVQRSEALTAFNLAKTCHAIRRMVAGDCLFYRANHFQFSSMDEALDYLIVIGPRRRNAILSIGAEHHGFAASAAFVYLSQCQNLERLSLSISCLLPYMEVPPLKISCAPGYSRLLKLRGLKSFELIPGGNSQCTTIHAILDRARRLPRTQENLDSVEGEFSRLGDQICQIICQPRGEISIFSAEEVEVANRCSRVDMWGGVLLDSLGITEEMYDNQSGDTLEQTSSALLQSTLPPALTEEQQWAEKDRLRASWDH